MSQRLGHGETITIEQFQEARASVAESVTNVPLAFAAAQPVDLKDFDFMFPKLQKNPNNLLPETAATPANLARLGQTMIDNVGNDPAGDSDISAIMTYFGQFIDHDITLELTSADLTRLTSPSLAPLPLAEIRNNIRNARTATLDLDSVYDLPAPRDGDKMVLGKVSPTGNANIPLKRPKGKGLQRPAAQPSQHRPGNRPRRQHRRSAQRREPDRRRKVFFTMRLLLPDGFKIQPHWHPKVEHVTVISGTFNVGMGDKFDQTAIRKCLPGRLASGRRK